MTSKKLDALVSILKELLKEEPMVFTDIGAKGGIHEYARMFRELTHAVGFEPDLEEIRKMQDSEWSKEFRATTFFDKALSDEVGEVRLNITSADTNTSVLTPNMNTTERYNMAKWRVVDSCKVEAITLDKVFENRIGSPDWIKIDVQGYEYEVLTGGKELLKDVSCVVAEVSFFELYSGQSMFSEIEQLMRSHGLKFYGFIERQMRSTKRLDKENKRTRERMMQADAVFFRDPLDKDWQSEMESPRRVHILLMILVSLEYYDFALEILEKKPESYRTGCSRSMEGSY